jgi:hypothetical protein
VPFWTTRDLERKLASFRHYYNRQRVHRGLDGAIPDRTSPAKIVHVDDYRWKPCCRGLCKSRKSPASRFASSSNKRWQCRHTRTRPRSGF